LSQVKPVLVFDRKTLAILAVNDAALALYGHARCALLRLKLHDLSEPGQVSACAETGTGKSPVLWKHSRSSGEPLFVEAELHPLASAAAGPEACLAVLNNVTETQLRLIHLSQEESRWRQVIDQSSVAQAIVEAGGRLLFRNRAFDRFLSPAPPEPNLPIFAFVPEAEAAELQKAITQALSSRQCASLQHSWLNSSDGNSRVRSTFNVLSAGPDRGHLLMECRTADSDSPRPQDSSFRSVGQLAAGVAHHFNNILTVVNSYSGLLLAKEQPDSEGAEYLHRIARAVERAGVITNHLLLFAKQQPMRMEELDLNELVHNLSPKLLQLLNSRITLDLGFRGGLPRIRADRHQLEVVIVNMTRNSLESLRGAGQISIRTSLEEIRTPATRHPEARTGTFVCLAFADTGGGIARDAMPQLFTPFYTTKDIGEGLGLGLAAVFGIVHQHEGWIEVESEVGRGAQFRILLPCTGEVGTAHGADAGKNPSG
jgi:signal transduction histidine kinase